MYRHVPVFQAVIYCKFRMIGLVYKLPARCHGKGIQHMRNPMKENIENVQLGGGFVMAADGRYCS